MQRIEREPDYELVSRAILLAITAHQDQVRKSDGTPYIHHPLQVGLILSKHGYSHDVIAAGILHDVVEDTPFTYEDIVREVGKDVADLVMHVTEDKMLVWEDRKRVYREHLKDCPHEAVAISLADRLHNKASQLASYEKEGNVIFTRFNRNIAITLDNDFATLEIYKERLPDNPMIAELEAYLKKLRILASK